MPNDRWTLTWSSLIPLIEGSLYSIPTDAGVYRLSYRANNENIYVFYVGKAENLQQRISQHLRGQDDTSCISRMIGSARCYLRYALVSRDYVRSGAERALYKYYKPQCNSQEPSGIDIEINFD
jgi:excinuclease UvrABC nuclease subunit